jgi:GH15 family glucan-1,4-alpha-glucosidase
VTDVLTGDSHPAHPTVNGSPFPPIADYGFLSDCEVCALVAPSGNVEWMCLPRMDGPSIFADAHQRLSQTADFWHEWVSRGTFPDHPWREYLVRSALTLKGLTYAPTGALIPLLGFLPPDDPRVRSTVLAIADELTEDGLVLRYRVEETDDGFSGEEGSFTICSFWLVSALTEIGEVDRARALCEKLLSYASPLFLYAEEIDAHSGRQLGNFPQAFSHLALINAVMHLIREDERRSAGGALTPALDLHAEAIAGLDEGGSDQHDHH